MRPFLLENVPFNDGGLPPPHSKVSRRTDVGIIGGSYLLTGSIRFFTLSRLFGEAEEMQLVQALEQAVNHIVDFCCNHPTGSTSSSVRMAHSTPPPPKRSGGLSGSGAG